MLRIIHTLRIWFLQCRGNFLLLSVVLVAIGFALAVHTRGGTGRINMPDLFWLNVGVLLAHASVNLFNDYFDYYSGIDAHTSRTPFSGGSGVLQSGQTSPRSVLFCAIGTLFCAALIGFYFAFTVHWFLIPIILLGGLTVIVYTRYFSRWLLGEFFTGLTLGTCVVWGSYIVLTANPHHSIKELLPLQVLLVSIIPGLLTFLLLLLNEFPDLEADTQGGRFHLVILLGRVKSVYLYIAGLIICYGLIIALPWYGVTGWWILLAGVTMPLAIIASLLVYRHAADIPELIPALGMNVLVVLATDALLACGLLVDVYV